MASLPSSPHFNEVLPGHAVGNRRAAAVFNPWLAAVALFLIFFASRVHALTLLPLHFDEAVHLKRALEVWNGHPFWDITDGRIINQWAIAALYPQNAPVFVARAATILVAMPGFAAGYALARRWFGQSGGLLAAIFWLACPYLFFYERTALADAEAGSLAVVTIWAALRLSRTGRRRDAVLTGLALAVTLLFKFTAAPFLLSIVLLVLFFGKTPWRQRGERLLLIGLTILLCFAAPLLYSAVQRRFGIAASWLVGSGGHGFTLQDNFGRSWAQLVDYGTVIWSLFLGVGLLGVMLGPLPVTFRAGNQRGRSDLLVLLGAAALPLVFILFAVAFVMPRHLVVGVPIMLTLGGAGLGLLVDHVSYCYLRSSWWRPALSGALIAGLAIGVVPFARIAYSAPGALPLPPIERGQYLTGYSAGFGLREAVQDFPHNIGAVGTPIIASMYPDGCRLANFYDLWGHQMRCTDAPGLELIENALEAQPDYGVIYVLTEAPPIGLDPSQLAALPHAKVTRIDSYPRPGEGPQTASVVLWQIQRLAADD